MKKLIHFNHYSDFSKKKVSASADNTTYRYGCEGDVYNGTPDIKYSQIVFVKDTHQICTHGELYDCNSSEGATKAPINLGGIVSGVQIQDTSANEIDYVVWDAQAKILLGCKKEMLLKYYSNWSNASTFGTRSGNDWIPFNDVFYIIGESLYIGRGGTLVSFTPKPATTDTDGLMSALDKTKLDGIDKSVITKSASVARGTVMYMQIDTLYSQEHVGMWRIGRTTSELSTNKNYGLLVVADDWGNTMVSQLYFGSLNPTDWQTPEDEMPYIGTRRYKNGQWTEWERIGSSKDIDLSNATDINVASTHPEDISPDGAAIVVREANRMGAGSGTVYNSQAPRIGFNWKDRWWAQILMVGNVFKFVRGKDDTAWAGIQAGEIQGTEVKTSSGIKLSSVGSVANLETDDKSTLVAATNELAGRVKAVEGNRENISAPKSLVKIYIDTDAPIPAEKGVKVRGTITAVFDNTSIKKYVEFQIQGASSARYEKKNWTIDFFNDELCQDKFSFSIGNMLPFDRYVWKANYIDYSQSRNILCNRLWEKMCQSRGYTLPDGALGHIDGYSSVLYINGEFYGLGSFNIGKELKNYEPCNFLAEAETHIQFNTYKTGDFELRKGDTSFLFYWYLHNTYSGYMLVKNIENSHDFENLIDYFLFLELIKGEDNIDKNFLLRGCSIDGKRIIQFMPYDLDSTFGLWWDGTKTTSPRESVFDSENNITPSAIAFWKNIEFNFRYQLKERYKELRDSGVFSVESIVGELLNISRPFSTKKVQEYVRWLKANIVTDDVEEINAWIAERIAWMDSSFGYIPDMTLYAYFDEECNLSFDPFFEESLVNKICINERPIKPSHPNYRATYRCTHGTNKIELWVSAVNTGFFTSDISKIHKIKLSKECVLTERAFANFNWLEEIDLGGITELPEGLLYSCDSLRRIKGDENIVRINSDSLADCASLDSINLRSLEFIEDRGFASTLQYPRLYEITLSDRLTHVGKDAFQCKRKRGNLYYESSKGSMPNKEILDQFIGWILYINKVYIGEIIPESEEGYYYNTPPTKRYYRGDGYHGTFNYETAVYDECVFLDTKPFEGKKVVSVTSNRGLEQVCDYNDHFVALEHVSAPEQIEWIDVELI